MRLQEIHFICKEVRQRWSTPTVSNFSDTDDSDEIEIHGIYAIDSILTLLDPIAYFRTDLSKIRDLLTQSVSFGYRTVFKKNDAERFLEAYSNLRYKVSTIAGLFDSIDYGDNPNSFNIKLPPNISLLDLSKCTRDLNTVFSTCPLFTTQEGTITFSSVDVGSVWLSFAVGGVAAASILAMVAALVDKAIIIRSHYLTTKEQSERINRLQLGNEILEQTVKTNKQLGKLIMDKVSSDLANEQGISDPEDISRIKNSIQLLSDWMAKGMEVYAAIQAPEEIKAVFPPVTDQFLPDSTIALLTDGSDTNKQ